MYIMYIYYLYIIYNIFVDNIFIYYYINIKYMLYYILYYIHNSSYGLESALLIFIINI